MFKKILFFVLLYVPLMACASGVFPTSKYNAANVTISGGTISGVTLSNITFPPAQSMLIQDIEATGVAGGASAVGVQQRVLNTIVFNNIVGVPGSSLFINTITLPTGSYNFYITAPAYNVARHRAYLVDGLSKAIITGGTSSFTASTGDVTNSTIIYHITITAPNQSFGVAHYTTLATPINGLGVAVSDGQPEIYTSFYITKDQ